ncbi:hypothetical protein FPE53_05370 [Salmonella enterica subsp. enterica]|uniref:Fimbrial protein n=2 Tax=Salmonella enterica TaxID=28901 RepID=A0A744KEL6_SALER|nr:hypothetical protein [Salmonella enterica subsp. enterica serovar Aqua]ECH1168670.1 hypothetical protein [Salmonella enterica subsp. enterica serovar Aqua]EIK6738943.1 hypothetical protein [Salmonella enterica subsp. enterica serovar Aqua]HAF2609175.1 hypothetical protein [Salmonella enterica]
MKLAPIALLAALASAGAAHAGEVSGSTDYTHQITSMTMHGTFKSTSTFDMPVTGQFHNQGEEFKPNVRLTPKSLLGYWPLTVASPGDFVVTTVHASGGNAADIGSNPANGTITLSKDVPLDKAATAGATAFTRALTGDQFYIGLYSVQSMTTSEQPTTVDVTLTAYGQ